MSVGIVGAPVKLEYVPSNNKLVASAKLAMSVGIVGAPVKSEYAPLNNVGLLVKSL